MSIIDLFFAVLNAYVIIGDDLVSTGKEQLWMAFRDFRIPCLIIRKHDKCQLRLCIGSLIRAVTSAQTLICRGLFWMPLSGRSNVDSVWLSIFVYFRLAMVSVGYSTCAVVKLKE